ncbi:hypothetical protein KCP75_02525 [Salmonella enterica subsp. enterica]|nr:hypothetical protein KCP75_02525 [Salmonella enterica subsp. enterica]
MPCHGAGCQVLSSPLADAVASSTRNRGTHFTGLAARSARRREPVFTPVRDCWRRVASARRQWIARHYRRWRRADRQKIARGGKRLSDSAEGRVSHCLYEISDH